MNPEEPQPEKATANYNDRHINPVTRWKWEAATKVHPANPEKGIRAGVIEYPDGRRAPYQR